MMEDTVIQVEGLTKVFGDFTAVNNISFHVKKGRSLVFWEPMELARPLP